MIRSGILAAAAVVASTLAGPALAQEVISNPGYCAQFYPNANCQTKAPGNPYTGSYQRQVVDQPYRDGWRNSYNQWDDGRVWTGDITVAGRVGVPGAIAGQDIAGQDYARRNGFVCVPGTLFRAENGRTQICQ